MEIKKFEVGKTYTCGNIGNSQTVYTYKVVDRTKCTITVREVTDSLRGGEFIKKLEKPVKFRIIKGLSEYVGKESVYPEGKFAKCPILSAE